MVESSCLPYIGFIFDDWLLNKKLKTCKIWLHNCCNLLSIVRDFPKSFKLSILNFLSAIDLLNKQHAQGKLMFNRIKLINFVVLFSRTLLDSHSRYNVRVILKIPTKSWNPVNESYDTTGWDVCHWIWICVCKKCSKFSNHSLFLRHSLSHNDDILLILFTYATW